MTRAAWIALVLATSAVAATPRSAVAVAAQDAPTLGAGNYDKLAKYVRGYYGFVEDDLLSKAGKELEKLIGETDKLAKAAKVAEPLSLVDDWRQIVRKGLLLDKPTAKIGWRNDLRIVEVDSPLDARGDLKELTGAFDGKYKAFVSVPADFAKVAYPVVIGLHPMEDEVRAAKDLTRSKAIVEKVKEWATANYSKEFLAKAIVVCPVMDFAQRGSDNVSFSRPRWDSDEGARWAFWSLAEVVGKNLEFDPGRVFVDGHGSGAMAALLFCSRFPGAATGAIVRGEPPQRIDMASVAGTPVLFVGDAAAEFHAAWSGKQGYTLTHVATLDDATLAAFVTDHPKDFAPKRVAIHTEDLRYASAYWFVTTDEVTALEKLPIQVDAVYDRDKNEVVVVTNEKVASFEIFLNDAMLDLSKPVRVVHRLARPAGGGGEPGDPPEDVERFNGPVRRTYEKTLEWAYYRPFSNTGEIYTASIPIQLR